MNKVLQEQLIGHLYPCQNYGKEEELEHVLFLREADEFSAASSMYIEEKYELLANAAHRYQHLINTAVTKLNIDTAFLSFGQICFNFYSDIASRFGLGTQAYTTETKPPYVGVSELSLQDMHLIQLILVHEMQHAYDFTFLNGLNFSIAERELRSRLSICKALNKIKKAKSKLYQNSVIDQAYWYIILFLSPKINEEAKYQYYYALEPMAQKRLSLGNDGIIFPPLLVRILNKELVREDILLSSKVLYHLINHNGKFILKEEILKDMPEEEEQSTLEEEMEEIIVEDNEPLVSAVPHITGENKKGSKKNKSIACCNKMVDWHLYEEQYKLLKQQASIIVTRDKENYNTMMGGESDINLPLSSENIPLFSSMSTVETMNEVLQPQTVSAAEKQNKEPQETEFTHLDNIYIPPAALETKNEESSIYVPQPVKHRAAYDYEDTQGLAEDVMANLSDFVKRKGTTDESK